MVKICTSEIKSEEVTQILQPTFFIALGAYEYVYISDSSFWLPAFTENKASKYKCKALVILWIWFCSSLCIQISVKSILSALILSH